MVDRPALIFVCSLQVHVVQSTFFAVKAMKQSVLPVAFDALHLTSMITMNNTD